MKTTIYIKETESGQDQVVAVFDQPDALGTPEQANNIRTLEGIVKKVIRQQIDNENKT